MPGNVLSTSRANKLHRSFLDHFAVQDERNPWARPFGAPAEGNSEVLPPHLVPYIRDSGSHKGHLKYYTFLGKLIE